MTLEVRTIHRLEVVKTIAFLMGGISLLAMSVALIISVGNTDDVSSLARNIEASTECRFDLNAEISDVNDLIDYWTSEGLKALVEEDQTRLDEVIVELDRLGPQFRAAIDERGQIVERCQRAVQE